MSTYLISVRAKENTRFLNEPGETHYLNVPDSADAIQTSHIIKGDQTQSAAQIWLSEIFSLKPENIAIYIHGYNYSQKQLLTHLRSFNKELKANGFKGIVIGFDWPSATVLINYIEDRIDAKQCASRLLNDCIWPIMHYQTSEFVNNIHLLAHSTGAYIVKKAFERTQNLDFNLAYADYQIGKIVFFAGDVSQKEMQDADSKKLILKHCEKLINYYNKKDEALEASNNIRLGLSPRVGQEGISKNMPEHCINKNLTDHFNKIKATGPNRLLEPFDYAYFTHMWYFNDPIWYKDLSQSLL